MLKHNRPPGTYYEFVPRFSPQLFFATLRTALLRVHKDRRARALLWRVLLPIVFLVAFTIYVIVNKGAAVVAICVDIVMFGLIIAYRRRRPVEQSGPLTLHLSPSPELADLPDIHASPELLREFGNLALLNAMLAHRAASEGYLKHQGVPEGKQIVTRQNHIRLLREYSLYDRLGNTERGLILLPDGAWDEDTIDRASLLLEPVRVFRWLLGIDPMLPLIGEALLIDFRLAGSLLDQPKSVFAAQALPPIEDIRAARAGAEKIFYRCYTEGQKRGFYIDPDAENAEQAIFYAERMVGQESEDILLGNIIVSRASDEEVRLAASVALNRIKLLRWVQDRLYGAVEADPELTAWR